MEAHIRSEFELSVQEYRCLLRALQSRFGVRSIEDVAFLSAEQLAAVTDRWEAAAVKRIFEIVTAHIGVEKLHRSLGIVHKLDLASDKRQGQEEVAVSVADHTAMDETV
jgi:5-methylthioribose kinase